MNDQIKHSYVNALKEIKTAKGYLGNMIAEEISYGMSPSADIVTELDHLSIISGNIMSLLLHRGESVSPVNNKPGFVQMIIDSDTFIIQENKLNVKSFSVDSPVKEEIPPVSDAISDNVEDIEDVEEQVIQETLKDDKKMYEAIKEEKLPDKEECHVIEDDIFPDASNQEIKSFVQDTSMKNMSSFADTETTIEPLFGADIYFEEKTKKKDTFVFDNYQLAVTHAGANKSEDVFFMIAPLEIFRKAVTSAPIIVYVLYKGRSYYLSSLDNPEDGKNTIVIQVGDYEFLCRGSFDNDGKFQSSIFTTGISAAQGDKLQVLRKETHNPVGRKVGNGHIKYAYESEEGPGTIDVFPIEMDKPEFLILNRYSEWRDILLLSKKYGLPTATIYENGMKSNIICQWMDDALTSDIVPV